MKACTIEFSWHQKEPIYSLSFHPNIKDTFATSGGDSTIRLWRFTPRGKEIFPIQGELLNKGKNGNKDPYTIKPIYSNGLKNHEKQAPMTVEYIATLEGHNGPVNVVKFSPDGSMLASAGDDGSILIWKKKGDLVKEDGTKIQDETNINNNMGQGVDEYALEKWKPLMVLRGSLSDIYDLTWSPNSQFLVTGSVDNTARIWDIASSRCVAIITDHKHYVQGVAWDPLNEYVLTQSRDRSVKIHKIQFKGSSGAINIKCIASHSRLNHKQEDNELESSKNASFSYLYQSENLKSFFRRPDFTPDGALIVTPAGIYKDNESEKISYVVHIYLRGSILRSPVLKLGSFTQPPIAVRCSPRVYTKIVYDGEHTDLLDLEYRCIFAVATQDSVFIYDTQHLTPIAYVSNLHYASLTDLSWSPDGNTLLVSSNDGYLSMLQFDEKEIGTTLNIAFYNVINQETSKPIPVISNKLNETNKVELKNSDRPSKSNINTINNIALKLKVKKVQENIGLKNDTFNESKNSIELPNGNITKIEKSKTNQPESSSEVFVTVPKKEHTKVTISNLETNSEIKTNKVNILTTRKKQKKVTNIKNSNNETNFKTNILEFETNQSKVINVNQESNIQVSPSQINMLKLRKKKAKEENIENDTNGEKISNYNQFNPGKNNQSQ